MDSQTRLMCGRAVRAQMLAEERSRLRRQQSHMQVVPLPLDALAQPAGRRALVRGLDFDTAVEMYRALAVVVIAKRFDRQRPERQLFLRKHHGDLPPGRAVDPRVGPPCFPAIQIRMADAGFHFPFAIGIMEWSAEQDSVTGEEYIAVDMRGEPLLRATARGWVSSA